MANLYKEYFSLTYDKLAGVFFFVPENFKALNYTTLKHLHNLHADVWLD